MSLEKIKTTDPDLFKKIEKDAEYNEIRSDEYAVVMNWLGQSLVTETMLSLLRKDLIQVSGVKIDESDDVVPVFELSESGKQLKMNLPTV